jgi:hypothetical protein
MNSTFSTGYQRRVSALEQYGRTREIRNEALREMRVLDQARNRIRNRIESLEERMAALNDSIQRIEVLRIDNENTIARNNVALIQAEPKEQERWR